MRKGNHIFKSLGEATVVHCAFFNDRTYGYSTNSKNFINQSSPIAIEDTSIIGIVGISYNGLSRLFPLDNYWALKLKKNNLT